MIIIGPGITIGGGIGVDGGVGVTPPLPGGVYTLNTGTRSEEHTSELQSFPTRRSSDLSNDNHRSRYHNHRRYWC